MALACRVLAAILFCAQSVAAQEVSPNAACMETDDQCDSRAHDGPEDTAGHALLATRVVRSKIDMAASPVHADEVAAVEELRAAVAKQGGASKEERWKQEQRAALAEQAAAALAMSEGITPPNVLLDANATEPFKGSDDPTADQERFDKDYVRDGDDENDDDDSMLFPERESRRRRSKKHKGSASNQTLEYEEGNTVEMKYTLATYVVMPLALVFLIIFTLSNIMEKFQITTIPESGIMIVLGVILGTFMKMYGHFEFFDDPDKFAELNSALLNLILLPIIIFASGWAIRRQDFYSQFPYILLFAIGGIALSTIVIACLIVFTGSWHLHSVTSWRCAFAFASLISATDPVATLSTYAKLKVEPLLNIMVFGESIINDAVAIVLFGVFNSDHYMVNSKGDMAGWELVMSIAWGILKIFCGSATLGVGLGVGYTLISHWADMRHNKKGQILVIFASCYLTYALAESIGMSGIIAEMFAALVMGVYMRPHLSSEGSLLATFFVKQLAMLADAGVCLLIGVSVVQLTRKGWYFGLWVMLFCLVGRCASVFPVGWLVNWIKSQAGQANGVPRDGWNLLSPQHMFMMWHAGLRGAIAMALSLELGQWVDVYEGEGTRRALQTATFLILCTFLLIFGGSTAWSLNHLRIPIDQDLPLDHLSKTEDMGPARGFLKWVDTKLLSPILVGKTNFVGGREEEKDVEDLLRDVLGGRLPVEM